MGDDTETLDMVKVENAWIPQGMAEDWSRAIEKAREGIGQIDFTTEEGKAMKIQAMTMFGLVDSFITQIEGAKTKEEISGIFSATMGQVVGIMMGGMM